jgi:signal transduction histidine kinase
MARILLVDDEPAGAAAAEGLSRAVKAGQIDRRAPAPGALARLDTRGYDWVALTPEALKAALAGGGGSDVLRETLDVFEDGVCLVAPDGALEVANTTGTRLYAGGLRADLEAAAREAMARGARADRSLALEGRVFAVRAYPLPGRGAVLYVRDATDEREREIGRLQGEKLASIGLLAAGVAHEINNPVGSSLTVASTLQRRYEIFAAEVARGDIRRSVLNEFLDGVREASLQLVTNLNRASELVHSFKQVAADRGHLERRRFDLAELTEQVLVGLRPELRKRGLVLDLACEPDLVMDSLPGPYGLVVSNLVLNSVVHAFPQGKAGTISFKAHAFGDQYVEIQISDDGCGMSPEVRRQAFDPFFTTRRHDGATGLGLHIAYSMVVDRLEGRLTLGSEPGAGTTVRLILPRSVRSES